MKTLKKAVAVLMTVLMVFSAMSVCLSFGATAATVNCNHDIGAEGSTLYIYSTIKSTCNTKGKNFYACTLCTFTTAEVIDEYDPDNHTLKDWQEIKAPTCDQDGEKIRYCEGCDYYEKDAIPATNEHTYIAQSELDFWWTVADIKVGDTYKGWKIEAIPTCFDAGYASTVCTACGKAEITADLPAHSYTYVEDESRKVPSTCVSTGTCYVVCSICNANFSLSTPIDEENHIWKYKVTTNPTCTQEGIETGYCPYHEDAENAPVKAIAPTGHTFKTYKSDNNASCQEDGTKTAECESCGVTETVTDEGSKLACLTQWKFKDKDTNCTTGGEAELVCIYCKKVYDTQVFAAGEHPETRKITVAATCTKDGYVKTICDVCGKETKERDKLDKTGHNDKVVNKTMSNCMTKTNRIDLLVCQTCGSIRELETPYTHRLVNVSPAVEATCTSAGKTEHNKCVDCGYEETAERIEALGHKDTDNDGCCNVCYVYFVENSQGQVVDCKCLCHNPDGIAKLFFKFINFFYKLFGANQICDCGKLHYETAGIN